MPIYEFQCSLCKTIKEELCSLDTLNSSEPCLHCLSPMCRIQSACVGIVKGGTPKHTNTQRDKNIKRVKRSPIDNQPNKNR